MHSLCNPKAELGDVRTRDVIQELLTPPSVITILNEFRIYFQELCSLITVWKSLLNKKKTWKITLSQRS